MFLKSIVAIIVSFSLLTPVSAHDFNTDVMKYILSNTGATLSEFEEFITTIDDEEYLEHFQDEETKLSIILTFPGKKYVANSLYYIPDFTVSDVETLIKDDPMLSEVGAVSIHEYLTRELILPDAVIEPDYVLSFSSFYEFLKTGFTHIIGGYDHILFLLTLIICLPKIRRILILITTFTVAHSLTIILGGAEILSVPSVIVESMILISIVIMAIYAMFQKVGESKNLIPETLLIFVLGLFHGLGFAGYFRSVMESSENIFFPIFAFNIGVELGQILILLIALTLLHYMYKFFPKYRNHIKNAIAIFAISFALLMIVKMYS